MILPLNLPIMTLRRLTVTFIDFIFYISSSHFSDITSPSFTDIETFLLWTFVKDKNLAPELSRNGKNSSFRCSVQTSVISVKLCMLVNSSINYIFLIFIRIYSEQKNVKSVKNKLIFLPA